MTAADWDRMRQQQTKRQRDERWKLTDRPISSIQAPKIPNVTPVATLPGMSPTSTILRGVEGNQTATDLLERWREVTGRIAKADRWFASNDESTDPQRWGRNMDLYCELMAESVRIAKEMQRIGVTCKEAAA